VISASLLTRLDARDRALFMRWVIAEHSTTGALRLWRSHTHMGGASATIALCTVPLLLGGTIAHAAGRGFTILVLSHLAVQIVKRSVGRPRPSCRDLSHILIVAPDRFSFPSGHAAAAMAVALAYATTFPAFSFPLLLLAVAVGISRICLGVHYPGDVIMGQLIAIATGAVILSV
jgi:undecaprenyl-diphosphatase